jgi:predicted transcriptional regulator YdeE
MTPNVTEMDIPPMRLAGVSGEFVSGMQPNSDAHIVIPQLWDRLNDFVNQGEDHHHWSAGIMNDAASGKMKYTAAVRFDDGFVVSEELEIVDFPGGSYVGCEHVGSLDAIGETTEWFYATYLPTSGRVLREGPHLEIYDERFNPHSSDSVVVICAPI